MKNCVRCKHFNDYCSMTGQEKNCPDFEPLEEKPSFKIGDHVSYNGEYGTINKIDLRKKQALVRFFGCTRWLRLHQIEKSEQKNFKKDL
jgi:hypothetical protein